MALLLALLSAFCVGCRGIPSPANGTPTVKTLIVTGYCPCSQCCGWHRTWYGKPVYSSGPNKGKRKIIGMTASGTMAKPGTIAADTSRYPFETMMQIEGYGYGQVEDRGGKIQGEHIDIYFRAHKQAEEWGTKRMQVKIWPAD